MIAHGYAPVGHYGENKNRVLHFLSLCEDPVTIPDIGEALGINYNALKVCMHRLVQTGQAVRVHRGQYLIGGIGSNEWTPGKADKIVNRQAST